MGFEIPIDVDYFEHPKTQVLVGLLGNEADIYPLRLWRWCALYARNGIVKGGRVAVETACKWQGTPGKLHRGLIKAGFLKKDGETVHDWMEHIGRAIQLYEEKKKRQRERYAASVGAHKHESNTKATAAQHEANTRSTPGQHEANTDQSLGVSQKRAKDDKCVSNGYDNVNHDVENGNLPAASGILPAETGRIPPIPSHPIQDEIRDSSARVEEPEIDSPNNDAAHRLAFLWRSNMRGKKPEDLTICVQAFDEMLALGATEEALTKEIRKGPPDRDRSEHLWQLKKRMIEHERKSNSHAKDPYDGLKQFVARGQQGNDAG